MIKINNFKEECVDRNEGQVLPEYFIGVQENLIDSFNEFIKDIKQVNEDIRNYDGEPYLSRKELYDIRTITDIVNSIIDEYEAHYFPNFN